MNESTLHPKSTFNYSVFSKLFKTKRNFDMNNTMLDQFITVSHYFIPIEET